MCRERGENVIHKEKKRMLKKKEQERALRSSGKLTFFFFFSKITCKFSNLEGKFDKNLSNYVAKLQYNIKMVYNMICYEIY